MFSDQSIKRLLKKAGAIRIGKSVIIKFKEVIEKESLIIARKAVKNAKYSGRKLVTKKDIEEAIKKEEEEWDI